MAKRLIRRFFVAISLILLFEILAGAGGLLLYYYYGVALPDHQHLATYEPPLATQVDAGDGQRLAEYATENRVFTPIETIPKHLVQAFLAAEDRNFYSHSGVDLFAVVRATAQNIIRLGDNRRPVGASTITQQVAKKFLLSNEVSMSRKIKEAILALRLEEAFGKAKILELYLNEIYFGRGLYGVAAAAQGYFGKPLDALTISEVAFLAALPKAPNNYNPNRFPVAAKTRRDWVIERMAQDGHITAAEAADAKSTPVAIRENSVTEFHEAGYFNEEVRRELISRFGDMALYTGGLTVHTTLDSELQAVADRALRAGLIAYDRRHGWRGRLGKLELDARAPERSWIAPLAAYPVPAGMGQWELAVVLAVDDAGATIGVGKGLTGRIPFAELKWARPTLKDQKVGAVPRRPSDVLARGDVVPVEPVSAADDGKPYPEKSYALRQIPDINGAIVALDPHTGGIIAMSGGYQFERSRDEFNRAVQAKRQPGSAFKPFVYLTAMNSGFTPSTLVSDGPFSMSQGPGLPNWEPINYDGTSLGVRPLRVGLERSRNLMTVRLAARIGMEKIARTAERFGIVDKMPRDMSMALGAAETTLLRLTTAYAQLASGGRQITPALIDWVRDRHGDLIYQRDDLEPAEEQPLLDDPRSIYQVVAMLRGVIERGTGTRAAVLGKSISGKTGTTNEEKDTWFIGFSSDLVCGVYVGFDQPRTLGPREQGASVALPIFVEFMKAALKDLPAMPFPIPRGIIMARVHETDGSLAEPGEGGTLYLPFKTGTLPARSVQTPDDSWTPNQPPYAPVRAGTDPEAMAVRR